MQQIESELHQGWTCDLGCPFLLCTLPLLQGLQGMTAGACSGQSAAMTVACFTMMIENCL